ncbi:unnamed protein product [Paramecium sonneborni]|uniref:Uncharacterized protein n=1 Tax=Paramecium sonneborni TaxID=65129 RepID=A0A8S1MXY8_9CILI|nr:unnamed protein product [Paramecium sonneborni]
MNYKKETLKKLLCFTPRNFLNDFPQHLVTKQQPPLERDFSKNKLDSESKQYPFILPQCQNLFNQRVFKDKQDSFSLKSIFILNFKSYEIGTIQTNSMLSYQQTQEPLLFIEMDILY